MQNEKTEYLRLTQKENAIDSLVRTTIFLQETRKDIFAWKWFIIALHHAAHCFMLVALKNSDSSGVWRHEPGVRTKDGPVDVFHEDNRLIHFMEAFKRIKDPTRMGGYINAKPFSGQPYHEQSMWHLNDKLRNGLVHYRPDGWSINSRYMVEIAIPVLEVIEFLVFQSGRCLFEENQLEKIKSSINSLQILFKEYLE